jgi:hypothetical protein
VGNLLENGHLEERGGDGDDNIKKYLKYVVRTGKVTGSGSG